MLNIPTTEERLGKSPQRLVRYFVLVMALVYLGLGIWALWSASQPVDPESPVHMSPPARIALGVVLIGYGLLRLARVYITQFRNNASSDDHD